ncbi:MAG TPA: fimbria/pilus outer membrane usher protein [Paraburkholderia sp.]|uniref:fimbria/pilus outer membrane usher protein n=1 Tax=Paraburkholderia sp. TaxID=1926495 RepID=UPI002B473BF4|nr:fimbria/pilus outer membrane usher protein [Paraburkholderia sp.]HKR47066.1 fimbria/pilus outer membrane usher protein [Paraburkholderia sp.]
MSGNFYRGFATFTPTPLHSLALLTFATAAGCASAQGTQGTQVAQVEFNEAFLQHIGPAFDVARFDKGNVAVPGEYRADLYVNETWMGRTNLTLKETANGVVPCFDGELLERIGLDFAKLPVAAAEARAPGARACVALPPLVPDATASFDNGEQRLDVSVPQAALSRRARGYVEPKYWDDGIPAALLQYNANAYHSEANGYASTQGYLGLTAGLNVGPWRFRHSGSLTTSTGNGTHYQSIQTNLQRAITPLKSQLTIGDAFTDGTMFDSVGFRGVQLATDDRMYPESQRGYAPTIHGIARSNAVVRVTQNGNVLYETNVAPGPFMIDDLYPTGYGGNLQVVVTEADGTQSVSAVPYAAAPFAVRPGITRFSVTAGEYRDALVDSKPPLAQATVQHGFTNALTGYGGVSVAQGYLAAVVGAALNTPLGAFAFDLTQANTALPGGQPSRSGQSLRLSYSELVVPTNTNITVAAYRYSSSGYLSLQDAMRLRTSGMAGLAMYDGGLQRNSFQMTLNQALPAGWGQFYLSGTMRDYWNRGGTDTQFQAGYNNTFRRVNYGVSASRQYALTSQRWDNRVMATVSVPLGIGAHAPYSTTSVQHDTLAGVSVQENVSGTLGADNAFSYGVNVNHTGGGDVASATGAGVNATWIAPLSTLNASAALNSGYRQVGGGLAGGVVAWRGGVALTPSMGQTMAIVEAKDAAGARIATQNGLRVDRFGHALVSNLTPFSSNELEIDPKGLPVSVELKSTSQHVAPTAGAVVHVAFETDNPGRAAVIRAKGEDGQPLPFGARIVDAAGKDVGTVAQGGRAVVRGLQDIEGELQVSWGEGGAQACHMKYRLPAADRSRDTAWTSIDSVCE